MASTLSVAAMSAPALSSVATRHGVSGSSRLAAAPVRLLRPARSVVVRAEVQQEKDTTQIETGSLSDENAERRADIGNARSPTFMEAQSFDGPAPETINGRLCMLAVVSALAAEKVSGLGIKEQIVTAPVPILLSFVLISLASYVPIVRGYTRKEKFANGIWTPKAENWNGRVAMLGFTALLVTEVASGMNTFQFWQNFFH